MTKLLIGLLGAGVLAAGGYAAASGLEPEPARTVSLPGVTGTAETTTGTTTGGTTTNAGTTSTATTTHDRDDDSSGRSSDDDRDDDDRSGSNSGKG